MYSSPNDQELKELGYTRRQANLMNWIDVECDTIALRKSKMGLKSGNMIDHLKYLEIYEPSQHLKCATFLFDCTVDSMRKNNEI